MVSIDQITSAQLEQYLLQSTTVSQARILNLSTDDDQPLWVVAFALTKTNGSEQPNNVVVKHLREALLEKFDGVAVVPKKWILLPQLPVASSGDIDDSELIQHLMSLDSSRVNLPMQDKLRYILSKVLRQPVTDIPSSASFIRLGGDSITAVDFMSRCLEQNIIVSVRDLMNCETLTELALLVTFVGENPSVVDQASPRVSEDTERLYLECFTYWDILGQPLQSMDLTTHRFDAPQETVELLLKGSSLASKMAPVEILVGAILDSFQRVFSDRSSLNAIVTCTRPVENLMINFHLAQNDDFKGAMRRAKDSFALARASQEVINFDDLFAELVINYNDQRRLNGQNNKYANSKLSGNEDGFIDDNTTLLKHSSVFHTPKRMPLFNIKITVSDRNCLTVELDYMRNLRRDTDILRWMDTLGEALETSIPSLAQSDPIYSLSDFPHLPLSYSNINSFLKSITEFGFKDIEAAYPTSAVQDGILLSQIRTPGLYRIDRIFKVYGRGESQYTLTVDGFEKAWNGVVEHNSLLRTVFVTSVRDDGPFDQIVLRNVRPDIKRVGTYANGRMATDALRALEPATFLNERPAHRLSICSVPEGHIYCKLEISHALVDGMSGQMLFKQICQSYDRWPPNTETVIFEDYISFLQTQPRAKSLEYWQNFLHGTQPCLFPTLVSQVSESETMKKIPIDIGSIDFKSFCMAHGITTAMLIQAVWAVVLRGYSLMDDVCFGYLASGRDVPMAGITKLIGPLINLLICRVKFDQLGTFEDLLLDLRDQLRHAMDNQYSSLAEIQHTVAPGQRQLFNTLVSMLYSEPEQPVSDNELDAHVIDDRAPTEFAVTLIIHAKASQLNISLNYFTSIMSDERAASLAASFAKVLNKILADPTSLISEVSVISDLDINRICADQSQLAAIESCAHWEIDKQIRLLPEEPAVASWDRNLTYAELGYYARRLAMKLQDLGVGPEVLVPLCFPKSAWAVVAMVAVEMAGGGFVPLDPSAPRLRLKGIIQDTKATLAIVAPSCEEILRDMGVEIYPVDEPTISGLPAPVTALTSLTRPCDVSFVIFTSGSTGEPKGMIHQHNGICSTAASYGGTALHVGPGTRVFQFSAYTFDIGILDVLVTLMRGGCICIPSDDMRVNDLTGALNTTKANWAFLTPSVADLLSPAEVPYLKTLALGGEAIPTKLAKKWKDAVELHGIYGPAEASCCAWNPELGKSGKSTNIGQALYSNFWVVSPGNPRQLVPDGCLGELLIQGPMLARGYINVNSKNWLEDVDWLPRTELSRAYLTGDIVCRNDDGSFEFKGRRDNQVKLHGQRVELGEIETKLQEALPQNMSGIIDLLTTEHSEASSLLAYLWFSTEPSSEQDSFQLVQIVTKEMRDTISNIHSSLSLKLPTYMIPAAYLIFTGSIEKTVSGKIDRRQLTRHAQGVSIKNRMKFSPGAAISQPPTTEMEFKLRDIWSKVLKVDPEWIGKNERFLQIGGDSITAIKLVTLARQQGINLTIAQIFQDSRLSYLAATASRAEDVPEYEIEPFGLLQEGESNTLKSYIRDACQLSSEQVIEDVYPSTSLQEGLMVLAVKQPGSYIAKYAYRLSDGVDLARFKAAWARTLELCGNLRTRFVQQDGVTYQALVKEEPSWEPTEDRDLQYVMDTTKAMQMQYGLRLCRYALCRGKGGGWHFVLIMHHTIFDGWSLSLVLDILDRVYTGVEIPPLQPYSSFINYMASIDQDESCDYWREQLDGAQRAAFPRIEPTTHTKAESRIIKTQISLPQSTDSSITKATIIRAAWALVLARYCDTDDVCFGITVSGRQAPLPGVERVSGPLVATVPVRVRLQGQQTVSQYLEDTQRQASQMIAHEQFGLQNISRVSADAKDACDFSSLLVIQPMEHINISAGDDQDAMMVGVDAEALGIEDVLEGYFTYPLVIQGMLYNDHMELMFIYRHDLVSGAQIEALSHHLEHVLQQLLVQTEAAVDSIRVAGDWDLEQAMKWNSQAEPTVVRECVHDMISAAGLQAPDKEAIYSSEGSMTFGELDHMSTQLSIHLAKLGVGAETVVSVCFEKWMWVPVAMLGILKAGGTFVFMEPSHPTSRRLALAEQVGSQITIVSPQTSRLGHAAGQVVELSPSLMAELSRGTATTTTATAASTRVLPSNAAYIIFTSGSTGTPKAIVVEHHAICTSIRGHGRAFGMNQDSRMLHFSSYVFDASVFEMLTTLAFGGTVCVPSDAQRLQDITGFIREAEVNMALLTPSFASTFGPDEVPTLKTLIFGGEAPTRESLMTWYGRVKTINAYGPAEACIICTTYVYRSADESPTTIGRGSNNACWIVDPSNHQRLAPIGCVGELLLHGSSLARGYANGPEAAQRSFLKSVEWLPSPLPNDERKFYKTGDLVKYNPDGTMQYIGRRDTQIKLRGQRIELAAIEHSIKKALPGIKHVAVDVMRRESRELLVAFIDFSTLTINWEADEDASLPQSVLRMNETLQGVLIAVLDKLKATLPGYMVPAFYLPMREMPFQVSMKLDRKKLRELADGLSQEQLVSFSLSNQLGDGNQRFRQDCSSDIELWIRSKWASILNIPEETISLHDNFYDLGGDSIRIVTVSKAIFNEHKVSLSLSLLNSKHTTIANIANFISSSRSGSITHLPIVSGINLSAKISEELSQPWVAQLGGMSSNPVTTLPDQATVFLTGATGYLGTEILRQLLDNDTIASVITLVRSESASYGLQRIQDTAQKTGWWQKSKKGKIEVWTGDLSKSGMGLDDTQWARLTGRSKNRSNVDLIIHNGATVNWNADYDKLRSANVDSVVDLLKAAITSLVHPKFVFVSGGLKTNPASNNAAFAPYLNNAMGYVQTKFVADGVVYGAISKLPHIQNRLSIVKPGRIIGSKRNGIANLDDMIWRVVAGAAAIHAYPEEPLEHWIDVTDVSSVASTILWQGFKNGGISPFVSITGGMPVPVFWDLVNGELEIPCKPLSWDSWKEQVLASINEIGESHPLWPVQHFLGQLGMARTDEEKAAEPTHKQWHEVVRSNLRYLINIGFVQSSIHNFGKADQKAAIRRQH